MHLLKTGVRPPRAGETAHGIYTFWLGPEGETLANLGTLRANREESAMLSYVLGKFMVYVNRLTQLETSFRVDYVNLDLEALALRQAVE